MVSDRQVRKLRKKLAEGKTVLAAADAAAMSEKSAHTWKEGPLPSEVRSNRERKWRTREDPFAGVWQSELLPLLVADKDGVLEATTLLKALEEKEPDRFNATLLRTLQRRVSEWRALHGPEREVYFEQVHVPGREGAFDFTNCNELRVTIQGALFLHLLFEFVLSFSKWRHVSLALSETFEAMVAGLQRAVWSLGGAPVEWRSDNLSAATHQLPGGGRELTRRYKALLDHYGVRSTRIAPGKSHENGVVEKSHHLLKSQIEQALVLRGSRDFECVAAYEAFVQQVVAALNRQASARLEQERPLLRSLPSSPVPEYTTYRAKVRCWSTIHFARRTYSVPSRLMGKELEIRQHATELELRYNDQLAGTIPRIRGDKAYRIDYRHVIWSLVRKPGAFARYRYREELFPSLTFRRAYDALVQARGERADVEYVRVLHLAASTFESDVERALELLLERGEPFDYAAVKALAAPEKTPVPDVHIPRPDLGEYDRLLSSVGGES
jgi:transposase InsO family protein